MYNDNNVDDRLKSIRKVDHDISSPLTVVRSFLGKFSLEPSDDLHRFNELADELSKLAWKPPPGIDAISAAEKVIREMAVVFALVANAVNNVKVSGDDPDTLEYPAVTQISVEKMRLVLENFLSARSATILPKES